MPKLRNGNTGDSNPGLSIASPAFYQLSYRAPHLVTVTNNVLHIFLKIFTVVKFLPCFTIIADTDKDEVDISTRFLPLSVYFFLYINMGMCFSLLYLTKIFKMAAELCKSVL